MVQIVNIQVTCRRVLRIDEDENRIVLICRNFNFIFWSEITFFFIRIELKGRAYVVVWALRYTFIEMTEIVSVKFNLKHFNCLCQPYPILEKDLPQMWWQRHHCCYICHELLKNITLMLRSFKSLNGSLIEKLYPLKFI